MPKTLIEKCSVRTQLNINDEKVNQGSGVVVKEKDEYFVVTASHCIHGTEKQYENIKCDDIWVEKQENYNSTFNRIPVTEVVAVDHTDDWALLRVQTPDYEIDSTRIYIGNQFIADTDVHFCGYQFSNNAEFRNWHADINSIAKNEFKISLKNKSFEQGGELGSDKAKGLSGSGVFIIRENKIYLIGHLKSVIGESALNDDIKCCPAELLQTHLTQPFINLKDIEGLESWEQYQDKKITDEEIQKWIESNDNHFINLNRKHGVLYQSQQAQNRTKERLTMYLMQEAKNILLRNEGNIIAKADKAAKDLEDTVKNDFSRAVPDSNAAKDLLIRLEERVENEIKSALKDNSGIHDRDLARHKVTWWLMNCDFDFNNKV